MFWIYSYRVVLVFFEFKASENSKIGGGKMQCENERQTDRQTNRTMGLMFAKEADTKRYTQLILMEICHKETNITPKLRRSK